MIGWYKKSNVANNLTQIILVWLRNSKNQTNIAEANDDISYQMHGIDNAVMLNNAINNATAIVVNQQGGFLTPTQIELINNLQNRIQDSPMHINIQQEPMLQNNQMDINMPPENINENAQNAAALSAQ